MNSSDNKPNRSLTKFLAASLTVSVVALSPAAHAADGTWTGAGTANWIPASGGTNWSTGVDAFPGATSGTTSPDIAIFSGTVANIAVGINNSSLNFGGIDFAAATNANYVIGTNGGNPLLLSGGPTGTPVVLAGAGSAFAITNRTSAAGVLRPQTIAAPIIIQNSGVTGAGSVTLLADSTGSTTRGVTDGSALKLTGTVSGAATAGNTSTLYLSGNGDFRNALIATGNEVSGVIQDQAVGSLETGKMSVTFTTPAVGSSASTIWYVSGVNTYTGGTTLTRLDALANSGALRVTNNSALGTGAITFSSSTQASGSSLQAGADNLTLPNAVTSGAAGTFAQISSNAVATGFTLSGVFSDNGVNTLGVVKSGGGTLNLTNNNSSYTLATQVSAGTLAVTKLSNAGSNSSIGTAGGSTAASGLLIGNAAISAGLSYTGTGDSTDRLFTINGTTAASAITATLSANGTGAVNFTNTGNIAYGLVNNARTLTLNGTNTGNNSLAAAIADNGTGIVTVGKSQAGTWVLSGANTYTGPTAVTGGTLATAGTGTLGLSNVTLSSGVTLTLGSSVSFGNSNTLTFDTLSVINMNFTGSDTLLSITKSGGTTLTTAGSYTAAQLNAFFSVTSFVDSGALGGKFTIAAVPEPGIWGVMIGMFGLLVVLHRRRRLSA